MRIWMILLRRFSWSAGPLSTSQAKPPRPGASKARTWRLRHQASLRLPTRVGATSALQAGQASMAQKGIFLHVYFTVMLTHS
jgi:hypothetical protein